MERIAVEIVPHTHWDREWYAMFETFRGRLVRLLDDLLPLLETDPGYAHFLLDGQLALVDDYLAVRPEAAPRLEALVKAGRVEMGPWYTLPDEFCVSGETLVRDLQLGLARAEALGGSMEVGYLPDMFGHVAQMPQILRLFGFDRAVVWRGVPAAVDRTRFWWSAPDGSTVRAEYLWWGYSIGAAIADDAAALVARVRGHLDELGDGLAGPLLFMNGTDHQRPQPWLASVVEAAAALAPELDWSVRGLADVLAPGPEAPGDGDGLPRWRGELRSGARANLLMGVASNRLDVKQAAAAAERALERVAEPLCALWVDPWPASMLADAWLGVIRNAAHDSSCACSIDDVCAAVLARHRSARATADACTATALRAIASLPAEPGLVVVNPTARTRGGVLELDLPGEGPAGDAQIVEAHPAVLRDEVLANADARAWLASWRSQDVAEGALAIGIDHAATPEGATLTLRCSPHPLTQLLVPPVRDKVLAEMGDGSLHLRVVQDPVRRVLCRVEGVPPFGWARWEPVLMAAAPVHAVPSGLANGLVEVTVDGPTFALDAIAGFGRLVESGDHGDTYNYSPPDHDLVVDRPVSVVTRVLETGPVRGRLEIVASYDWPAGMDSTGLARLPALPTTVTTVIELRAGEAFARVTHAWDNRSADHRVRAVLPLVGPARTSTAECAFGTVERGLRGEGGPSERAMATFPSRRFVQAGGTTVVHDGLLEYELVGADGLELDPAADRADAIALTLVRGTGMLSRIDVPYRPVTAGPPIATPGAQQLGPVRTTYAVSVADVDPFAMADEVLVPLLTARSPGGGRDTGGGAAGLEVEGAVVSAVVRDGNAVVLRVFNPDAAAATLRVRGRIGQVVDLRGRPLAPFDGTLELPPGRIATIRLDA